MTSPDPRFYSLREAMFNDLQAAQTLIEQDPSIIEARSGIGETALHYLCVENHLEGVRWLHQRGANINTLNNFQATPLIDAASLGYVELCRFLLANGADILATDQIGNTAISTVVCWKKRVNKPLLDLLLANRGEADINLFFDDVNAEEVLSKQGTKIGDFWRALGLKSRYDYSEFDGEEAKEQEI